MLKNIPKIIPPHLLEVLSSMGHGDEIVIADGNFPSVTCGKEVIRMDGHGAVEVLRAILELVPLDTYSTYPVKLMSVVKGDDCKTPIWEEYEKAILELNGKCKIEHVERFEFYERAKNAYAVVATGEAALYANVILTKGVIK